MTMDLHGQDAFKWFTGCQLQSVIRNGIVPEWFHGIISRKTAEELLMPKPPGYFLIRVSETRIGYTLSYRADDRCRHFMIDALEDGQYIIVGENRRHRLLQDLVDFHRRTPIMPFSEVLTVACGQSSNDKTDYAELLFPQRNPKPDADLLQISALRHRRSDPEAPEESIPPALPYRPTNLINPTVQSTGSHPNRLYPSLKEELSNSASPLPAPPMPLAGNRYTADNFPSSPPPEIPARNGVPPLKQNQACTRTVSAPQGPSTAGAAELKPSSVITNLKNFKKIFHKKRSTSHEHMYTEIHRETADGNTEIEYEVITPKENVNGLPFSYIHNNLRLTDGVLPQEYQQPPPFAPGY
ncbi:hematopoietic SH2 domain-containing protein homolog [Echeneis naucrates]|uniref:SH2 domain-containing protein n=1 Tax=Echeneis naucrates TaxID=173247 RepID=A0A665VCD7_ECHNA|nr:hematopoietic SH2 domain-containing protein [Echeneis naucrates]